MIYFLIPVYNEAENIPTLSRSLLPVLPGEDKSYVFVDDGSSDDTLVLLAEFFPSDRLHVLQNPGNKGPGYSFNSGFAYILDKLNAGDKDTIITLEGDNTSDLGILPVMFMLHKENYELVLASPYAQGGNIENASFIRKAASFFANLILRVWFGIKVLTLSSFYRIYSPALLRRIQSDYGNIIVDTGFISKVEILIKAIRVKAQIIEVPMILDSTKRKGKSKMKVFKTFLSYVKFFLSNKYKTK